MDQGYPSVHTPFWGNNFSHDPPRHDQAEAIRLARGLDRIGDDYVWKARMPNATTLGTSDYDRLLISVSCDNIHDRNPLPCDRNVVRNDRDFKEIINFLDMNEGGKNHFCGNYTFDSLVDITLGDPPLDNTWSIVEHQNLIYMVSFHHRAAYQVSENLFRDYLYEVPYKTAEMLIEGLGDKNCRNIISFLSPSVSKSPHIWTNKKMSIDNNRVISKRPTLKEILDSNNNFVDPKIYLNTEGLLDDTYNKGISLYIGGEYQEPVEGLVCSKHWKCINYLTLFGDIYQLDENIQLNNKRFRILCKKMVKLKHKARGFEEFNRYDRVTDYITTNGKKIPLDKSWQLSIVGDSCYVHSAIHRIACEVDEGLYNLGEYEYEFDYQTAEVFFNKLGELNCRKIFSFLSPCASRSTHIWSNKIMQHDDIDIVSHRPTYEEMLTKNSIGSCNYSNLFCGRLSNTFNEEIRKEVPYPKFTKIDSRLHSPVVMDDITVRCAINYITTMFGYDNEAIRNFLFRCKVPTSSKSLSNLTNTKVRRCEINKMFYMSNIVKELDGKFCVWKIEKYPRLKKKAEEFYKTAVDTIKEDINDREFDESVDPEREAPTVNVRRKKFLKSIEMHGEPRLEEQFQPVVLEELPYKKRITIKLEDKNKLLSKIREEKTYIRKNSIIVISNWNNAEFRASMILSRAEIYILNKPQIHVRWTLPIGFLGLRYLMEFMWSYRGVDKGKFQREIEKYYIHETEDVRMKEIRREIFDRQAEIDDTDEYIDDPFSIFGFSV